MEPPWVKHPDIEGGSIGWRMGTGEGYYNDFYRWFSRLNEKEQDAYVAEYPSPPDWVGVYETIQKHPWK